MSTTIENRIAASRAATRPAAWQYLYLVSKLILAGLVAYTYDIEGPAFLKVFALAVMGFAVNLCLPMGYRRPFFVVLSLAGAFVVFSVTDAVWLIGCGSLLIGLCHLPVSFVARVLILLAVGGLLAASRGGAIPSTWSDAVWPILGSMFMFRLVLYMRAVRAGHTDGGPWGALAYFFMLPNLVFPLFPVVDYQTFRRTYFDRNDIEIYEQGLLWIARGFVHLLLYRLVYQIFLIDPLDVATLGDLAQVMLSTFLLYLRVSGQFHLIVGILHLFGFRLPETHKLYYLSHSFTELWRRINIYWKEFMMQVVFYPAYFTLKRLGPTTALVCATVAVFFATWVLHSYQWFWLRGGFPLTAPDALFWGILGTLVAAGALKESKPGPRTRRRVVGWDLWFGLKAATTFFAFCFLWSLWSAESVGQWIWMLASASNIDAKGIWLVATTFVVLVALGGRDWDSPVASRPTWLEALMRPNIRTITPLVLLLVAVHPAVRDNMPDSIRVGLDALQTTTLNARDAAVQHRGYYEQLDVRGQVNAQVLDLLGKRPDDWMEIDSTGLLRYRNDYLTRDLHPSRSVTWNGQTFSTNRWGMRDQDYEIVKPPGTLRIALLGPSHVMGNGVSDGETFESLVEERLNREFSAAGYARIEILNFGVDGYTPPQQVALLEDRVLHFAPDIVIATHYHEGRMMTERFLGKVLWGGIPIPDERISALLRSAGLDELDRGTVPIPFAPLRQLAKEVGIDPRMPAGEFSGRIRRISGQAVNLSFERLAEVCRSNGVPAVVLALDDVLDGAPAGIPNQEAIEATGLPILDLFDVFPASERPKLRVAPWDNHPNKAGHELIADRLYEELTALLRAGAAADPGLPLGHPDDGRP